MLVATVALTLSDSDRERFEAKIADFAHCTPTVCWRWIGTFSKDRIPLFKLGDRLIPAFRILTGMIGPRFSGVHVRRGCRNHECVNPWHLRYPTPPRK